MTYGPLQDGDEAEISEILGTAFAFPPQEVPEWFARAGTEHVRVLRDDEGKPIAGLLQIPMGHFLGGASVPTIGIAGVGVALERRAGSVARNLMQSCVREIAERGVALSSLYPSTQTLYRSAGFERAGKSSEYSVSIVQIDPTIPDEGLTVRRLGDADAEAVESLYRTVASESHGWLDRGPYIWGRVRAPKGRTMRGFGFYADGELEGYVYLSQQRSETFTVMHDLWATDLCAKTARGYAAIFRFVRSQRSLAGNLEFRQAPSAPFLSLLKEARYDEKSEIDWMVRVTCLPAAVAARGYLEALRTSVTFEVRDDVVSSNAGAWTMQLSDGRATIERGGTPEASLDVRAFAALFTGYLPAVTLARLGLLSGSPAAIKRLGAIFASPTPAIVDMF